MYLFRKVVFNCKEATLLSSKKEAGKITLFERVKLSYHLLYCEPCRRFIRQWERINKEIKRSGYTAPPFALSDQASSRIQGQLDKIDSEEKD